MTNICGTHEVFISLYMILPVSPNQRERGLDKLSERVTVAGWDDAILSGADCSVMSVIASTYSEGNPVAPYLQVTAREFVIPAQPINATA